MLLVQIHKNKVKDTVIREQFSCTGSFLGWNHIVSNDSLDDAFKMSVHESV